MSFLGLGFDCWELQSEGGRELSCCVEKLLCGLMGLGRYRLPYCLFDESIVAVGKNMAALIAVEGWDSLDMILRSSTRKWC